MKSEATVIGGPKMIFEKQIIGIYNGIMGTRNDPTGDIHYFSHTDFEGLSAEGISFPGGNGQRLVGNIYYRGEKRRDRLIIFDHGMGCGHVAYMREIDVITRHGYTVLTYDHTGCRHSEGESVRGFAQSLSDLDHCIKFVKSRDDLSGATISVMGHSWGAFSTMNIPALHPEISHVVAFSGFISVDAVLSQFFAGPLKFYVPVVYKLESERNPEYVSFDARDSIKTTDTKALYIHSRDDKTVNARLHFDKLQDALSDRPGTYFIELCGRNHNPNYTDGAVALLTDMQKKLGKFRKKNKNATPEEKAAFVASFDWAAITEQDESLWEKIFRFLEDEEFV